MKKILNFRIGLIAALLILFGGIVIYADSQNEISDNVVYSVQTRQEASSDFMSKVAQLDIDKATLDDVIKIFGEPQSYIWEENIFKRENLPDLYIAMFNKDFHVFFNKDKIIELRFYDSTYVYENCIKVGSTIDEVIRVLGEPKSIVENSENKFEDGVLYRDISQKKGFCYYGRQDKKIRMFFTDYKANCIYITRTDYLETAQRPVQNPKDSKESKSSEDTDVIVDNIDLPFVNDPQIIGKWESVDFVRDIEDFVPGRKIYPDEFFLKEMIFMQDGKTFRPWWTWTKGIVINSGNKTAAKYEVKEIDGATYMFMEWKSGDYTIRHMKPCYYVLKKGHISPEDLKNAENKDRVVDNINLPFENDQQVIGKWESVDFVRNIEDFYPGKVSWVGELYLKEMVFEEGGRTFKPWWTWTKGVVMHGGDKTAAKYEIREIDGVTYMFMEWKNGDYIFGHMKPYYYVLKKVN